MSWRDDAIEKTRVYLENMVGLGFAARSSGMEVDAGQIVNSTIDKIVEIAEESFPLARVMDESDIVLHAEGPGASHHLPSLAAFNWLSTTVQKSLRHLSVAVFDLSGIADAAKLAKGLDMRLSGLAPGSIWMGVKVMPPPHDLFPSEGGAIDQLSQQIASLPQIVRFIGDEELTPGLSEFSPDPAMRDVQLSTLLSFTPTGQRGIHTLELASRASGMVSLSQRERVVLREAIRKPEERDARRGSFIGYAREVDLDKTRIHLRDVDGVGTLRCVVPELGTDQARKMLGGLVRAEGRYLPDRSGRPRLLFVERIESVESRQAALI